MMKSVSLRKKGMLTKENYAGGDRLMIKKCGGGWYRHSFLEFLARGVKGGGRNGRSLAMARESPPSTQAKGMKGGQKVVQN